MDTIELIIDEQMAEEGINAISLVEFPANIRTSRINFWSICNRILDSRRPY